MHTLLDKKDKCIQYPGVVEGTCVYNKFQHIVMKSCYIADGKMVRCLEAGDNKTGGGTIHLNT